MTPSTHVDTQPRGPSLNSRLRSALNQLTTRAAEISDRDGSADDLLERVRTTRDACDRMTNLAILQARTRGLSWQRISAALRMPAEVLERRMRLLRTELPA